MAAAWVFLTSEWEQSITAGRQAPALVGELPTSVQPEQESEYKLLQVAGLSGYRFSIPVQLSFCSFRDWYKAPLWTSQKVQKNYWLYTIICENLNRSNWLYLEAKESILRSFPDLFSIILTILLP